MSVKLVAHRGESEAAPENTLEAFTLAWATGRWSVCMTTMRSAPVASTVRWPN